jgi:hypothetical protein
MNEKQIYYIVVCVYGGIVTGAYIHTDRDIAMEVAKSIVQADGYNNEHEEVHVFENDITVQTSIELVFTRTINKWLREKTK